MPATVTLSTTTLQAPAPAGARSVKLVSTSGVVPGIRLWVDRELMAVVSIGIGTNVNVLRGVDGTAVSDHSGGATVTLGNANQFYASDPVGRPPEVIPVSPYINAITGDVWMAQGDALPAGISNRWWQKVTTEYAKGALGVRTATSTPTSSD